LKYAVRAETSGTYKCYQHTTSK